MTPEMNATGFMGLIEGVGGADQFIWLVMFSLLLVAAAVLVWSNRNNME